MNAELNKTSNRYECLKCLENDHTLKEEDKLCEMICDGA